MLYGEVLNERCAFFSIGRIESQGLSLPVGGGGTPYSVLYEEVLNERCAFFSIGRIESHGLSLPVGGGVHPIVCYTERFSMKGVPFLA